MTTARKTSSASVAPLGVRRGRPSTPFLRERILAGASKLFAARDFDTVSIDDVAALAKVGKGSVYRQFASKEELYAAVVMDGLQRLQAEIRRALADASSFREQFVGVVHRILVFFWPRLQFFALIRDPKALPARLERQYSAQRGELARLVEGVISSGIDSGAIARGLDTRMAAETLLGMLRGINRYCRDFTNPEEGAEFVTTIFLEGCAPAGAGPRTTNPRRTAGR
jgi:AcrR family transcriptional regulator